MRTSCSVADTASLWKWWQASFSNSEACGVVLAFKRIKGHYSTRAHSGQGVTLAPLADPDWVRLLWLSGSGQMTSGLGHVWRWWEISNERSSSVGWVTLRALSPDNVLDAAASCAEWGVFFCLHSLSFLSSLCRVRWSSQMSVGRNSQPFFSHMLILNICPVLLSSLLGPWLDLGL